MVEVDSLAEAAEVPRHRIRSPRLGAVRRVGEDVRVIDECDTARAGTLRDVVDLSPEDRHRQLVDRDRAHTTVLRRDLANRLTLQRDDRCAHSHQPSLEVEVAPAPERAQLGTTQTGRRRDEDRPRVLGTS